MAKIDLDLVERILKRAEIGNNVLEEIMGELQSAVHEDAAFDDEPKTAPVKKQFVVLAADSTGELADKEIMGWVLQLPEDEPMQSISEKITRVAKAFNLSKKGRRYPVETVGETCENVPAKIFKEQKLWLKTKTPVLIVPINNDLDLDAINLKDLQKDHWDEEAVS